MTTPPHEMTKAEAVVRLCDEARAAADPELLRAVCIAVKCLTRYDIHKRRNHASRAARGLPPKVAPTVEETPSAPEISSPEIQP